MDWKSPAGFDRIVIPRYIDWRYDVIFEDDPNSIPHVHDIGSRNWFQAQNKSVQFYLNTDFNTYFVNEKEVIQSHGFDFTYALLRNKHFKKKVQELGLHHARCKVCCIWNYLFRQSSSFIRNSAAVSKKKLGLTPENDLIFVDLSYPLENLPQTLLNQQMDNVLSCVEKVASVLRKPVCVVASNDYFILRSVRAKYPKGQTNNGLFFTRERYHNELTQLNSTAVGRHGSLQTPGDITIPRTEQNALMYFFMGYYLQLNSTVLFASKKSLYSENMAALRHYYRPTDTYYVPRPDVKCKLDRYR